MSPLIRSTLLMLLAWISVFMVSGSAAVAKSPDKSPVPLLAGVPKCAHCA